MRKIRHAPTRRKEKRALASLFMFFSFVWLLPSGVTMHYAAKEPNGAAYHVAMAVHWAASLIFFTAIVVHLVLNWKPLTRHMLSEARERLAFSGETVFALLATAALVLLIASHVVFL